MGKGRRWTWQENGFDTEEHLVQISQARGPQKHHELAIFTKEYQLICSFVAFLVYSVSFVTTENTVVFHLVRFDSSNNCSLTCCLLKELMHFLLHKNESAPPSAFFKFGPLRPL